MNAAHFKKKILFMNHLKPWYFISKVKYCGYVWNSKCNVWGSRYCENAHLYTYCSVLSKCEYLLCIKWKVFKDQSVIWNTCMHVSVCVCACMVLLMVCVCVCVFVCACMLLFMICVCIIFFDKNAWKLITNYEIKFQGEKIVFHCGKISDSVSSSKIIYSYREIYSCP